MDWYDDDTYVYNDYEEDENENTDQEEEEIENPLLTEYKKYWKERYSPEHPGLLPIAQARRQRILNNAGEWAKMRELPLARLSEQAKSKRSKQNLKRIKELLICQNITPEERKKIPKDLLVTLLMPINKNNNKIKQRVCYSIPNLYAYLTGKYGNNSNMWVDPYTKILYTIPQERKLATLFKQMFPCKKTFLQGRYTVEQRRGKGNGLARVQIPDTLYHRLIQENRIDTSVPLILQIVNIAYGNKRILDINSAHAVFVGLDEISSHPGSGIKLDKELMEYLNLKDGEEIWLQDCTGLPVAKRIILRPLDSDTNWLNDFHAMANIRTGLEDYINKNYYAVQVPQKLQSEWDGKKYHFEVVGIIDENDKKVLSAISTRPGGHELELDFSIPTPV